MAQFHAFASSRPTFTVPAIRRAVTARQGPAYGRSGNDAGSPATGIVIAAALGAAMWGVILQLVL